MSQGEAKIVGGPAVTAQYVVGAPTQGNPVNLPVAEPAPVATATPVETDAALAARLQEEELLMPTAPPPPAVRTRFVESHYYGPASFLSSVMLFCIFPPCAIVPWRVRPRPVAPLPRRVASPDPRRAARASLYSHSHSETKRKLQTP